MLLPKQQKSNAKLALQPAHNILLIIVNLPFNLEVKKDPKISL